MKDPAFDLMQQLIASRLDKIGPGGGRWRWRNDAALIAATLCGRHLDLVVKATGYSKRRCHARIRHLMPAVLHRDARQALLAELRRRARSEVRHEH